MKAAALVSGSAAALLLLFPTAAVATPTANPTQVYVQVDCQGSSATMLMHPGIGKAVWDVSVESVSESPNFLIRHIYQEVYVNGDFLGSGQFGFGKKTGQTDRVTCDTSETLADAAGNEILVVGWVELIKK